MTHKIRFHGVLPLFTLIAAAVLRQNLAILSAAPAVFAACLGIPFALERAHAMTFSRGRMLFNLLFAVLITAADAAYFFAMKSPDAMLSVVTVIRRCSVLVTFLGGALILTEGHIRDKALVMVLMMAGVGLLLYATTA